MAQYRITYWKDIPTQVEAFDGADRVRRPLSGRFQELIDVVAMRTGLIGTDAYLEAWRQGPVATLTGTPEEVAATIAAQLEARYEEIRGVALAGPS